MRRFLQYIKSKKILKPDVILAVILVAGLVILNFGYSRMDGIFEVHMSISNAYIAQMDADGNTYVVDEEHGRVLKLDEDKNVVFSITGNERDDDTISYVGDMAIDDDGNIYLVEDHWGGMYLDREAILVYDSDGQYVTTVYDDDFDGDYVDKRQVIGLTVSDGALWYAVLEEDYIQINRMDIATGETAAYWETDYENAFNAVYDVAILPEQDVFYVLDKRGEIVRIDGEIQEIVYATADDPEMAGEIAFYTMSVDSSENIYLTDIKGNYIYKLNQESGSLEVLVSGDTALSINVAMLSDGREVLSAIYGGQLYEMDTEGNILWQGDVLSRSSSYLMATAGIYAVMLLCLVAALWLAIRIIALLVGLQYSKSTKNSMLISVVVIIVVGVIVTQLMSSFRSVYTEELFEKLYISAHAVSNQVDADILNDINDPEDFMSDSYNELMDTLDVLLDRDYEYNQNIYCNILKYEDGEAFSIAYLDQSTGCYYPLDEVETAEVLEVYETGLDVENGDKADVSGAYAYVKVPVFDSAGNVVAVVAIGCDTYIIDEQISEMQRTVLITLVTIILTIMFLFGEGLGFMDLREKYRDTMAKRKEKEEAPVPMHMVRLIVFITFLAFNMGTSFLSAYAAKLVANNTGLAGEFAASLPLTLNLAFMGIMSLFCAPLMARFSFKRIAMISALISFCGDMTVFLNGNYMGLVVGLILNGIGVGLITNCINMFIVGSNDKEVKRNGLTVFNSGSVSGYNIGSMLGASIAGVLGQQRVFAVSSAVWMVVALMFLGLGKYIDRAGEVADATAKEAVGEAAAASPDGKKSGFWRFVLAPSVWGFMLCVQIPYIMLNSFISYYVPIYGANQGYSENVTALLLMVNSLCSVFFGVSVSNFMSKRFGHKSVYISTIMSLAALLFFASRPTVTVLIITLLVMGISTSFGVSAKGFYFTELPKVKEYGEEESMGVYNLADNGGESIGPMVFGPLMASGNLLAAMGKFVGVIFGAGAIYGLLSRRSQPADKERS